MSELEQAQTAIENAHVRLEQQLADLLTSTGTKKYSDEVHAQQVRAAVDLYDVSIENPLQVAQREQEAAEQQLQRLGGDPLNQLSTEQIARAQALAPFVKEDSERLTVDEVAAQMRAALAGTDRVQMYLWARYGKLRAQQERSRPGDGSGWEAAAPGEVDVLNQLALQLEAQVRPDLAQRRKELQATLGQARDLQYVATSRRPKVTDSGEVADGPSYRFLAPGDVRW